METVTEPPTPTPSRTQRGKTTRRKDKSNSLPNGTADTPRKSKPKRRSNNPPNQSNGTASIHEELVSPLTPPRLDQNQAVNPEVPTISPPPSKRKNARGRQRTNTKQEPNTGAGADSNVQSQNQPIEQSQATNTPVKSAPQKYAGPTFHASPAASSLPIPRFFAKSNQPSEKPFEPNVPDSEENSELESSSGDGDESPSLRNSLRADESHAREPSPLDIFFKADRAEKARRTQSSPLASSVNVVNRAKSASPSTDTFKQNESGQHSRRQIDTAMAPDSPVSNDIKAKTEALKQLLLVPRAQHSSPALSGRQDSTSIPSPYGPTVKPSSSGSSTPSRTFHGHADPTRSESSLLDSLHVPVSSNRTSQLRRPLPSHVRQDLLNKLPMDQSDTPSKPSYVMPVVP